MSELRLYVCISPPLSHCIVRALFRTAIVWRFLAALLPMPFLASSSALSFLITAHSCSASRRWCHYSLAFPFWQPGALGVWGIHNSTEYARDAVVFVQHIWQPNRPQLACSSLEGCSFRSDCDDLCFFDFVVKLLECCIVKGHAIRQFCSQLPLLKLIHPISFSLCLLLYLCFIHPPFGLHFNVWPVC